MRHPNWLTQNRGTALALTTISLAIAVVFGAFTLLTESPLNLSGRLKLNLCDKSTLSNEGDALSCIDWEVYLEPNEILYVFDKQNGLLQNFKSQETDQLDFKNKMKWAYKGETPGSASNASGGYQEVREELKMQDCTSKNPSLGQCRVYLTKNELGQWLKLFVRPARWYEGLLIFYQNSQVSPITNLVTQKNPLDLIFRIEVFSTELTGPTQQTPQSTTELSEVQWSWFSLIDFMRLTSLKPKELIDVAENFTARETIPMKEVGELQRMNEKDREAYLRSQGVQVLDLGKEEKK